MSAGDIVSRPLRVLHCLRAPVGGLFRHVRDLVRAQAEMGLDVGVICDSRGGGAEAELALSGLDDHCVLGIARIPMSRQPGLGDLQSIRRVKRYATEVEADILHGHGAKGGAYARLAGRSLRRKGGAPVLAFYTPHGASLHFDPSSLVGKAYIFAERKLAPLTDGLLFESSYAKRVYEARIGPVPCPSRIVPNGLYPREFYNPVVDVNAADFVFVGELRDLKGVDVLIEALTRLRADFPEMRSVIVGAGPHAGRFRKLAKRRGILGEVAAFPGPMPARVAFARGRCVVVPSRAESFPYIVLEAIAAGMPLIATAVGGIPEMTEGVSMPLIQPGNIEALTGQMRLFLADPWPFVERSATLQALAEQRFTVLAMAESIVAFYFDVLEKKPAASV